MTKIILLKNVKWVLIIKCPECNTENPKDIQHCENCGEKLIEDEFKLYGRRIIYIGIIISATG